MNYEKKCVSWESCSSTQQRIWFALKTINKPCRVREIRELIEANGFAATMNMSPQCQRLAKDKHIYSWFSQTGGDGIGMHYSISPFPENFLEILKAQRTEP